ncbi:hypothetical protein P731_15145 [Listeria monocytogenes SHL014]|nr:hypothetical protein P731_15145 [Listeria monocytogenes SHL014]
MGPLSHFGNKGSPLGLAALGQWSTPRAEVLPQPDQAFQETASHRPFSVTLPVGCESTVQSQLFLSFPKIWKQDTLGTLSPFGNKAALWAWQL